MARVIRAPKVLITSTSTVRRLRLFHVDIERASVARWRNAAFRVRKRRLV
jgi:hypothetical protein